MWKLGVKKGQGTHLVVQLGINLGRRLIHDNDVCPSQKGSGKRKKLLLTRTQALPIDLHVKHSLLVVSWSVIQEGRQVAAFQDIQTL